MKALLPTVGPLLSTGAALTFLLALGACAPAPIRIPTAALELPSGQSEEPMAQPSSTLPVLDGPPLRVLLRRGGEGLKVAAPGGLRLCGLDGKTLAELSPRGRAGLSARSSLLAMDGSSLGVSEALILPIAPGETVRVGGRRYRGRLVLKAKGSALALVNIVGLEDYLRGVLPSEVGSSGPAEALKAQAVAARSFAVTQMEASASKTWDLDNSADSQVYRGEEDETEATDRAVRSTRGTVLAWRDSVAHTYFHSNSGGHTADVGEVWGGSKNPPLYLQGVLDSWSEDQGHYRWKASMGREEVERRLVNAGLWSGFLEEVEPRERSESDRWTRVDLLGHQGQRVSISANDFRKVLGPDLLRSTNFTVRLSGDDFVFDGLGWGHGVGLSQEGAFAMAREGRDYRSILDFYYPGTRRASLRE